MSRLREGLPLDVLEKIQGIFDIYTDELILLRPRFRIEQADTTLTGEMAITEINAFEGSLREATNSIAATIGFAVASGNVGQILVREIRDNFLKGKFNRLEAQLQTNMAGYRSGMEIRKAKEIEKIPKFEYIGARDDKNRPFCRHVLNQKKKWSISEINALDKRPDAQLLPVLIYGGGWNCRHRWVYTNRG